MSKCLRKVSICDVRKNNCILGLHLCCFIRYLCACIIDPQPTWVLPLSIYQHSFADVPLSRSLSFTTCPCLKKDTSTRGCRAYHLAFYLPLQYALARAPRWPRTTREEITSATPRWPRKNRQESAGATPRCPRKKPEESASAAQRPGTLPMHAHRRPNVDLVALTDLGAHVRPPLRFLPSTRRRSSTGRVISSAKTPMRCRFRQRAHRTGRILGILQRTATFPILKLKMTMRMVRN